MYHMQVKRLYPRVRAGHSESYLLSLIVVLAMVFAATTLRERALIYPPMAALATGLIIAERSPWKVRLRHIPVILSLTSLAGTVLARLLPHFPIVALSAGILFTAGLLTAFHSTFFPSLATCLLPIVLHLQSWYYPASVLALSALIVLLNKAVVTGWQSYANTWSPQRSVSVSSMKQWAFFWIGALPALLCAVATHTMTLIAPPLIVVFATLCQPGDQLHRHPSRILTTVFLVSCYGAAGKILLAGQLHVPLAVSVALSLAGALTAMRHIKLMMPPLSALSVLPFAIPSSSWSYPVWTSLGTAYFLLLTQTNARLFTTHHPSGQNEETSIWSK